MYKREKTWWDSSRADLCIELFDKCFRCLSDQELGLLKWRLFEYVHSEEPDSTSFAQEHNREMLPYKAFRESFKLAIQQYYSGVEDSEQDLSIIQDLVVRDVSERLGALSESWLPGLRLSAVTALSGEAYESSNAAGQTVVIFPSLEAFLSYADITAFHENNRLDFLSGNSHAIRKQLNLCGKDAALAVANIGGVFKTTGIAPSHAGMKYSSICFVKHLSWELFIPCGAEDEGAERRRQCLTRFANGHMCLPALDLEKEYAIIAKDLFGDDAVAKKIAALLNRIGVKKGTSLVIARPDCIAKECGRLVIDNKRGTAFEGGGTRDFLKSGDDKIEVDDKLLSHLVSIDGALLIDTDCKCHGFGVILDGEAVEGNPARGARYNSMLSYARFFHSSDLYGDEPLLCAVFSEDGMVDIMPEIYEFKSDSAKIKG